MAASLDAIYVENADTGVLLANPWLVSRFRKFHGAPPHLGPTAGDFTVPLPDAVITPHHYSRFAIEPIRFIRENNLPFWAGNVIKYTCRHDAKDGLQDLKKARRYLDMEIARMEGNAKWNE